MIARTIRIYLDTCCLGRLYDDDAQERVRLEAEAVEDVVCRIGLGEIILVVSNVLLAETKRDPSPDRQERSQVVLDMATMYVDLDDVDMCRAKQLHEMGFGEIDAMHIVAAEKTNCDAFLTTDDQLIRRASRYNKLLQVRVINPADWVRES